MTAMWGGVDGRMCQACEMQIYSLLIPLHKAYESGGRVRVVLGRRNPFPKTQGRLTSERSSREEKRRDCLFLINNHKG